MIYAGHDEREKRGLTTHSSSSALCQKIQIFTLCPIVECDQSSLCIYTSDHNVNPQGMFWNACRKGFLPVEHLSNEPCFIQCYIPYSCTVHFLKPHKSGILLELDDKGNIDKGQVDKSFLFYFTYNIAHMHQNRNQKDDQIDTQVQVLLQYSF